MVFGIGDGVVAFLAVGYALCAEFVELLPETVDGDAVGALQLVEPCFFLLQDGDFLVDGFGRLAGLTGRLGLTGPLWASLRGCLL